MALSQSDTQLSPLSTGYQGWDATDFGSIYTVPFAGINFGGGAFIPNVPAGIGGGVGVDGSGNLWIAGQQYTTSATSSGSQLTEFIGLAAPAPTPLAKALINAGGPGVKP